MLIRVEFSEKVRERIENRRENIELKMGVNLLVGFNGSGKSTILKEIFEYSSGNKKDNRIQCVVESKNSFVVYYFDFEKGNPRVTEFSDQPDKFMIGVLSRFKSHGEMNLAILNYLGKAEVSGGLIIMDEPEQALDFKSMLKLVDLLQNTKAKQVLIATHNPFLIFNNGFNVIELSKDYVKELYESLKSVF